MMTSIDHWSSRSDNGCGFVFIIAQQILCPEDLKASSLHNSTGHTKSSSVLVKWHIGLNCHRELAFIQYFMLV
uniref:Uncharacterized protein n=1 Tax=Arundo donax TaxID=35708 RepID=A0A0A9AQY3_ARUDO